MIWFASPNAIRVMLALRALRSLRELKGLNARELAFSRQACLNQIIAVKKTPGVIWFRQGR